MPMLLSFGAKNIFSFKEGFEVDFSIKANEYSNLLAFKGANASGKTSLLKALSFMLFFIKDSFSSEKESLISYNTFFHNDDNTLFYIKFLINNTEYKYEVELNTKEVISEKMYKKKTLLFHREALSLIQYTDEYKELTKIKLRHNTSIISASNEYDFDCTKEIYGFFNFIYSNVGLYGLKQFLDYKVASQFYHEHKDILEFIIKILKKCDTGIDDIKILEEEDIETKKMTYIPQFYYKNNGQKKALSYFEQSSGVKSLYKALGIYKIILSQGGLLILDEFDINLHPDLLPILIDFFESSKKNPKNAQLIFTTHNTDIMDKMKKYRIYMVEKEENESYLYRLDEIKGEFIRNDRPISSLYKAGRLGGKPKINL